MFSETNIATNYIGQGPGSLHYTLLIDLTLGEHLQILCERRWRYVQKWHRAVVTCATAHGLLVYLKPNSITLASSELAPDMFGDSSELG